MAIDSIDEEKVADPTGEPDPSVAANEADDARHPDESTAASEAADGGDPHEHEDGDSTARSPWLRKVRFRPGRPWRWVSVLAVAAVIAGDVVGFLKYRSTADELSALRQSESDREAAAKLAKDYALKSLTYSFDDPDAFFRSVEDGVSQALKDKYINATELLKGVMLQGQVTSTGEVLATDAVVQPGQIYQVVVSAAQTTRNLQNPKPRVSLILLQITVSKAGDSWQVSDIGPKIGSHSANANQVMPPQPAPGPPPAPPPPPPPRR
jgi:Mce-associated membrane protein